MEWKWSGGGGGCGWEEGRGRERRRAGKEVDFQAGQTWRVAVRLAVSTSEFLPRLVRKTLTKYPIEIKKSNSI